MSERARVKWLLLLGVVLFALTTLVVIFGFRRTEELRTTSDLDGMMLKPRPSAFGVSVGLQLGHGEPASRFESSASFEDGLTATIVSIKRRSCTTCGPDGMYEAVIALDGGRIPPGVPVQLTISPAQLDWSDHDYVVTLANIMPDEVDIVVTDKLASPSP